MSLQSFKICSAGLIRTVNQDRAANLTNGDCGLFLVADGMGGHYAGEIASKALLNSYSDWWIQTASRVQSDDLQSLATQLKRVLIDCNRRIYESTPPDQICGSTLVLLFIQKGTYVLLSVGDSRCYQVSTRGVLPQVRQLTRDDIRTDKANYGKLTQAVGSRPECTCFLEMGRVPLGTIFALCSDGIYKYCEGLFWSRSLIGAFLSGNLAKTASRISQYVQENGAGDNYSLVLVRV